MKMKKNDNKLLKILISDLLSCGGCGYCCCGGSLVKGKGVTYRQTKKKGSSTRYYYDLGTLTDNRHSHENCNQGKGNTE
jgi:hypothetical protein